MARVGEERAQSAGYSAFGGTDSQGCRRRVGEVSANLRALGFDVEEGAEGLVRDRQGACGCLDVQGLLLSIDEGASERIIAATERRRALRNRLRITRDIRHSPANAELRV